MVAERHSHGGDREVGQGRGEVGRALCFCYVKDAAQVTKVVVVMKEEGGGQSHEDGS